MITTIILAISAVGFISSWGCHGISLYNNDYCMYQGIPILSSVPIISGFILAVIPECLIFNIAWYWMFLINAIGLFLIGPFITRLYLVMLASGKGFGVDCFRALILGIISLIIGIILMFTIYE
ncbi:MAG: hypothetical protein SNG49_04790 [Rikenellaceae bacterium]